MVEQTAAFHLVESIVKQVVTNLSAQFTEGQTKNPRKKSTSGNWSIFYTLHCIHVIHCCESLSETESYFGLKLSNYTVISRILTLEQAAVGYENSK